jgi:hypothetical protein
MMISGVGAVATHARAGGTPAAARDLDPGGGGLMFSDQTTYGPPGKMIPELNNVNTRLIGAGLHRAYYLMPGTNEQLERAIIYRVDINLDKTGGQPFDTSAMANSDGTTSNSTARLTNNPLLNDKGRATAQVAGINPGYAVGIVVDPSTYQAYPSTDSGSVLVSIGDSVDPLSLQAEGDGAFASAFFTLGTDRPGDDTLISFSIGIDSTTASAEQADISIPIFNPDLGWTTRQDFENYLLSFLAFNSTTHTLSASGGIPLYQANVGPNGDEVTLSFTNGSIAGISAVPEPGTFAFPVSLCTSLLVVVARFRRRKRQGVVLVPAKPPRSE